MKNIILIFYFGIVSLFNTTLITPFLLFPNIISNKIFLVHINSFLLGLVFVLKFFYKIKIMIENDSIINTFQNKKNIILSNHLSEFDYMFIYNIISMSEKFSFTKNIIRMIMTKTVYKMLPGIGMASIFLGSISINHINKNLTLDNLKKLKINNNDILIMFCEGDIQYEKTLIKSIEYAKKLEQKPTKNIIFPKTTGFEIIRSNNPIDEIIYITLYYSDIKIPICKPIRLLTSDIPKEIYISFDKKNIAATNNIGQDIIDIYRSIDDKIDILSSDTYKHKKNNFKHYDITISEMLSFFSQMFLLGLSIYMILMYRYFILYNILLISLYYFYVWKYL